MTVHGTAQFATRSEVKRAGLLTQAKPGEIPEGLMLGWWLEDSYDFEPISYRGDLHQLIVGGTGGGKFTSAIAPLLLGSGLEENTVVVVDPKGEIAQLAGPFFQKAFAETPSVFLLDPWDLCATGFTSCLNVLEEIRSENPSYVDDARALADAMIIPSGSENTHWDNAARNFLTGIILYVALAEEEKDNRDLVRVRELITQTWAMPKAYKGPKRPTLSELLFKHLTSDLAGGAVRRAFTGLLNREDKERSGIISSIERDTAWIDSPPMAKVLQGASLDLKQAALAGGKYFIVLPFEYFKTHRAWLRLMVTTFAKAMKRHQPDKSKPLHKRWRHIVIDEFTDLGEMSFILSDVAVARSYDIKYHFTVQTLTQLKHQYKDGWETFIGNSFQRYFALNDLFTTEYVSRLAGSATVEAISRTVGHSQSISHSWGTSTTDSTGTSTPPGIFRRSTTTAGSSKSSTDSYSETRSTSSSETRTPVQRALITPDEARRLGGGNQVLFMRDMQPILCWRPAFWEIFLSLPTFDLKEILGTIGRMPKDEAERKHFTGWRDAPLLIQPPDRPLPGPKVLPLPPPAEPPADWRPRAIFWAIALLVFLGWFAARETPTW